MKKVLLIAIPVIIAAVAAWYFFSGSGVSPTVSGGKKGQTQDTTNVAPPPVSTTAGKISAAEGTLSGRAERASGSAIDFTTVKVAIYDPKTNKELARVSLGADGSYTFAVTAGEYILDLVKGTGSSKNLPQHVYVGPRETIELNFQVGK